MPNIPIDWSTVPWAYVVLLAAFTFVSSLIGHLIAFKSRFAGAILAALLFVVIFVFTYYYPHGFAVPSLPRAS
jgi:hypothetical protein